MAKSTLEFSITAKAENDNGEAVAIGTDGKEMAKCTSDFLVLATYATTKMETDFYFPVDVQPEDVAGMATPFNRVKAIKELLTECNPDISKKDVETFLDSKFAIERAKAALAVSDDTLDVSYIERTRKDGSVTRTIKANDKVLTKADMKRMLDEQANLLERAAIEKMQIARVAMEDIDTLKKEIAELKSGK